VLTQHINQFRQIFKRKKRFRNLFFSFAYPKEFLVIFQIPRIYLQLSTFFPKTKTLKARIKAKRRRSLKSVLAPQKSKTPAT